MCFTWDPVFYTLSFSEHIKVVLPAPPPEVEMLQRECDAERGPKRVQTRLHSLVTIRIGLTT